MDENEKQINKSFFKSLNLSFQSQNYNIENISKEPPKNPYITKDHVPELVFLDKKTITCDKKKYDIKDYLEMI